MKLVILDCYTDEASGLGVPPYIGTYPRYLYGYLKKQYPKADIIYLTIDDVRLWRKYDGKQLIPKKSEKTNIATYNLTVNSDNTLDILDSCDTLYLNLGVHVPGKYLSAVPGTLKETIPYIKDLKCKKILTGPATMGTQLYGGKYAEKEDLRLFDKIDPFKFAFEEVKEYAVLGSELIKQIPDIRMIEIETGKGCNVGKCSFCTEPLKSKVIYRENEDILKEIKSFYKLGARYFRLGKQTCFYSLPDPIDLLKNIGKQCPGLKVLHIDNANPVFTITEKGKEITKALVKYCTPGNVAAFGVESFDLKVTKANTLNCSAKIAYKAIQIMNDLGSERGDNGLPKLLPGINIIFGLMEEDKETHKINMEWLSKFVEEDLLIRRINIRQVAILPGTRLCQEAGNKFLKKNKKYYWKWRNDIRQKIDFPFLEKVMPKGTILKDVYAEIYDGDTTFGRQFGTYPIVVGIKGRLPLKKFVDVKVISHNLRSVEAEVVS
jgi:radical SAM superfamily enzyme with C-terminal helix-hairpin-helix motif